MEEYFDKLLRDPHPQTHIPEEIWKSWTRAIANSEFASATVSEISSQLGLKWFYTRQGETISQYLGYSIADICTMRGFGGTKRRAIILCIAALGMKANQAVLKSSSPTRVATTIGESTRALRQSILQKTILDVLDISDEDKQRVWDYCENIQVSHLLITDKEWTKPQQNGVYLEDSLDVFLALSFEYIYQILPDEISIENVVDCLVVLVKELLRKDVNLDIESADKGAILKHIGQATFFVDLMISNSFVPQHHIDVLHGYGILKWGDLLDLSEYNILSQYGLNSKSLKLITVAKSMQSSLKQAFRAVEPIIMTEAIGLSFSSIMQNWVHGRTMDNRAKEIILKRMAWGCERPETLDSIGQRLGLSRERVRQIEHKTIIKLRHHASTKEITPFWVFIESYVQEYGIVNVSELAQLLTNHFYWTSKPSEEGLSNFVNLGETQPFAQSIVRLNEKYLCLKDFKCHICSGMQRYLTERVHDLKTISIQDAIVSINHYCMQECQRTNKYWDFSHSFIEYLVTYCAGVSDHVRMKESFIYSTEEWDLRYGSLLNAVEAILKQSKKAMHFSEVSVELRKLRSKISLNYHNAHALLGRSDKILLWDRGTYIHKQNAPFSFSLVRLVEDWLKKKLADDVPFVTVFGAFKEFQSRCAEEGVPSESALYSCLRVSADPVFSFPKYPYIYLSSNYGGRVSVSAVIEEFIKDFNGLAPLEDIKRLAIDQLNVKEVMLSQYLERVPNVLRTKGGFIHIDALDIETGRLSEILSFIGRFLSKEPHVSVIKIFSEKKVSCKIMGINDPVLLFSILQIRAGDIFGLTRYPQIRRASSAAGLEAQGIIKSIIEYVRQKQGPCTYQELYDYFSEKLGYPKVTVYSVIYREGIYRFLPGCIIHEDAIGLSMLKQKAVERIAQEIYADEARIGKPYGLIGTLSELPNLPDLDNGFYWTEWLLKDILSRSDNIRILGNKRNAFVCVPNSFGIHTFEDLCYDILSKEHGGAANLAQFSEELSDSEINSGNVTVAMLGNCEKVCIANGEIILTELLNHA